MKSPVLFNIVENGLCIGCGSCAALCPQKVLEMRWNQHGEYNPVEVATCRTECGICLKVCPFADTGENEDSIGQRLYGNIPKIAHTLETGYFLECLVGYSDKRRHVSASGGVATWLLETLLTTKTVDHVICVAPNGDPEKLFTFNVFDTAEDVRTGAGSAYYPVEMSEVLKFVLSTPGKYAITGLPCFIKSIRLAQQMNKYLRERIVVTVGLTCGQLKSKHYTSYLISMSGMTGTVPKVSFRGKDAKKPVSNFYFSSYNELNEETRVFWNDGVSEAWINRWFTLQSCNFCDDVFAECADITCMDAWLPEYSTDNLGTNLLITRSPEISEIIEEGRKMGEVHLDKIAVDRVIYSQAGVIKIKRGDLVIRLALAFQKGQYTPKKRVLLGDMIDPLKKLEIRTLNLMQSESDELFRVNVNDGLPLNTEHFRKHFKHSRMKLSLIRRILRVEQSLKNSLPKISKYKK